MKPIQHEYHAAVERIQGLPSRTSPSAVELFALDEQQVVGLASLELEAAPAATIARSARRCRELLEEIDKRAADRDKLSRKWTRKLRNTQWEHRMARLQYEQDCADLTQNMQQFGKHMAHRAVMLQHRLEGTAEAQLQTELDGCARIREGGAYANQVGLETMVETQLDISERYNCTVKNWDRSTPRALPSPRVPKKPESSVKRESPRVRPSGQLGSFAQDVPRRASRALEPGRVLELPSGSPRPPKPPPQGKANTVSSRTLQSWLLTEDPDRKPPAYSPPGARPDHRPRTIIQACFPSDYVPSQQRHAT